MNRLPQGAAVVWEVDGVALARESTAR